MILHVFPKCLTTVCAMLEDGIHACSMVGGFRLRQPSSGRAFGQRSTANAKHFPVADHVPGRIQGFHTHPVWMECRYVFWLPDKTDIQRRKAALDSNISEMAFPCGCQTAKKVNSKGLCLRKALPEKRCSVCRSHRMTAGRAAPY